MRKILLTIVLLGLTTGAVLADTIYLRDGSVINGTFLGYENGQFLFEIEGGRRIRFRPDQVTRLVIDRGAGPSRPEYPSRDPNENAPRWETVPTISVPLQDQWIRTQVQLQRGQRVRVRASGTVTLEGRIQTGPDGLENRRDEDAPLPEANDGALIAAIGQDVNSPPIFVGSSNEFIAEDEGVLYFTVNHWETRNARGAFRVEVSVDRNIYPVQDSGPGPTQGREQTITVRADQPWTDTGIDVEPGMTFQIVAEGEIFVTSRFRSGPDGNPEAMGRNSAYPVQDHGPGALIGKLRYRNGRDSNVLFIGTQNNLQAEPNEYGRLLIGINDDNFRDNRGSYRVTIRW